MFRLTAKIEIRSAKTWVFDKVASVEITRDIETLTDTCVLQLPKKVKWQGESTLPIKRGDEVTVWLGYDGDLQFAFRGFITTLGLKTPTTITCEDYMFRLKQREAKKLTYKDATIGQILKDQKLGIGYKVFGEQSIGQYRVTADTLSALLGQLKDHAGVRSFIRIEDDEPVLYSGVLFERGKSPKQVFATGLNLIDDTQLKVQNAADVKIKVKAVSLMPNNKKIRVEVGDTDGETRTLHTYNKQEAELKAWAKQELERLKRDGLVGSFTTFGAELVDKLDNVGIKIDGERKGVYQVQKNVIKYSRAVSDEITLGASGRMTIQEAIRKMAAAGTEPYCKVCTVDAVDEDARTVDCTPLDEGAPLVGVNLQANQRVRGGRRAVSCGRQLRRRVVSRGIGGGGRPCGESR